MCWILKSDWSVLIASLVWAIHLIVFLHFSFAYLHLLKTFSGYWIMKEVEAFSVYARVHFLVVILHN